MHEVARKPREIKETCDTLVRIPASETDGDDLFSCLVSTLACQELSLEVFLYLYEDQSIQGFGRYHKTALLAAKYGQMRLLALFIRKDYVMACLKVAVNRLHAEIVWWILQNFPNKIDFDVKPYLEAAREKNFSVFWTLSILDPMLKYETWSDIKRFFINQALTKYDSIAECMTQFPCSPEDFAHVACTLNRLDLLREFQKFGIELNSELVSRAFMMGHIELGNSLMKHFVSTTCPRSKTFTLLFHLWDVINNNIDIIDPTGFVWVDDASLQLLQFARKKQKTLLPLLVNPVTLTALGAAPPQKG